VLSSPPEQRAGRTSTKTNAPHNLLAVLATLRHRRGYFLRRAPRLRMRARHTATSIRHRRSTRPQLGHWPRPNLLTRTANFAPFEPAVSTYIAPSVRFGRRAFLLSTAGCRRLVARGARVWRGRGRRGGIHDMPNPTLASIDAGGVRLTLLCDANRTRLEALCIGCAFYVVLDPESRGSACHTR
jgi:hypothetical protein